MPQRLTEQKIKDGLAVVLKAVDKPAPKQEGPDPLHEIAQALKTLADLNRNAQELLNRSGYDKPEGVAEAAISVTLEKMAEIHFLTQRTMESMSMARPAEKQPPRILDFEVTERDAWGRIKRLKAIVGGE